MALALRISSLIQLAANGLSAIVSNGNKSSSIQRARRLISLTSLHRARLLPYKLADIGEGIKEVTVKEWFIKVGDKVRQFENICEVQSDKASVTITSRFDGVVKAIHYKVDDICQVGAALVDIEVEGEDISKPDNPETTVAETPTEETTPSVHSAVEATSDKSEQRQVLTTPAVRKIAKENNVDLGRVRATGRDARVLKEDILAYLGQVSMKIDEETPTATRSLGMVANLLADKKYAKHMWKSMTQSLTIPHFVYSDECDVTKLVKLRTEVKDAFQEQGLSLSYMPFFLKAVSRALLQYPELNALINEETESADIKREHNISFAMDTPGGLVVPNIKNVQSLSVVDLAKELNRLQALGKKSSITLNDLTGGTFSISNIGIIGGTYTKPVILSPQVVIGALGKIQRLPRYNEEDVIVPANILSVSWAADHRVVDGVTMAKFSNLWKYYVENPSHLILGL